MIEKIRTFLGCFFTRKIESQDPGKADVIGAFAFAFLKHGPGRSNEVMAQILERLFKLYNLPIISQWEIDDAIQDQGVKSHVVKRIEKHRAQGKYLDTLEVAVQMVEKMKRQGWKKVVTVAHPLHVWRVARILERLEVEPIISPYLWSVPFEPKSEQWWTRNRILWTIKEIPIRLGSFIKGWI